MSSSPSVVVRKGGFCSTLVSSLFGVIAVALICVTGLGLYGLHVANGKIDRVIEIGETCVQVLPEWQAALPPVLSDALNDRRAPEYRERVDINLSTHYEEEEQPDRALVVLEVENQGDETISVMSGRVVLSDEDGVPRQSRTLFIATPFSLEEENWPGPMMPESTRQISRQVFWVKKGWTPSFEITELRIWNRGAPPAWEKSGSESARLPEPAPAAGSRIAGSSPEPE